MSSTIDPAKLKVVELRNELQERGLDTKGNKAALVQRLKEALEKETNTSELIYILTNEGSSLIKNNQGIVGFTFVYD